MQSVEERLNVNSWRNSKVATDYNAQTRRVVEDQQKQRAAHQTESGRLAREREQASQTYDNAVIENVAYGDNRHDLVRLKAKLDGLVAQQAALAQMPDLIDRAIDMRHDGWGEACRSAQRAEAEEIHARRNVNIPKIVKLVEQMIEPLEQWELLTTLERADFEGTFDKNTRGLGYFVPNIRPSPGLPISSRELREWLKRMREFGW